MLLIVLGASFLVMLTSLSGKLVAWRGAGRFIERNLHFFVSFAAGVLLVIAYNLSREIVEHAGSLSAGLPWIAFGAFVVLVAFRYLPNFHHHHDREGHVHSKIDANRILTSDAIHNIGDGVVIVVSFMASTALGIASMISIIVHEMLQEISEFFVLRESGMTTRSALLWNFATSGSILFGTVGGYFLLDRFQSLQIPLLGLSVGAYLVVVFHDLIPHSISHAFERLHYVKHGVYFLVGAVFMFLILEYLPHI